MSESIYDIDVTAIDGAKKKMSDYKGKTLVIVNVASQCGFTPQYEGLEKLYKNYAEKGLVVLGFPCNQFGSQEPSSEGEIKTFCETSFGVTFPMFAKVEVNGDNAHPLFQYLKEKQKGILGTEGIKWNFTKFLVDKNGQVVERFAPQTAPLALSENIEKII